MSGQNLTERLKTIERLAADVKISEEEEAPHWLDTILRRFHINEEGEASHRLDTILCSLHEVIIGKRGSGREKEKIRALLTCMLYSVRYGCQPILEQYIKIKQEHRSWFPSSKQSKTGTFCESTKLSTLQLDHVASVSHNSPDSEAIIGKTMSKDKEVGACVQCDGADEVMPLLLATQLDYPAMVDLLIQDWRQNQHIITSLSYEGNICAGCRALTGGQSQPDTFLVEKCQLSVEVMKSISSPAYLLASHQDDPVLETFFLSHLASKWQANDLVLQESFGEIQSSCKQFAVDMVDLCETSEEVNTLLNYRKGSEMLYLSRRHDPKLPRLQLAAGFGQKDFVVHNSCQLALYDTWSEGLPGWIAPRQYYWSRRQLYYFFVALLMPLTVLAYLLPFHKICQGKKRMIDRSIKGPSIKYANSFISHVLFIAMVIASIIHKSDPGEINTYQWIVLAWTVGLFFRYMEKLIFYLSPCSKARILPGTELNIKTLLLCLSFLMFYVMQFAHWIQNQDGPELSRAELSADSLILISELFYGVGCILAVWEIAALFTNVSALGPVHVSLVQTIKVIWRFFFIFFLILLAFMSGITYIYSGYGAIPFGNSTVDANSAFTNMKESGKSLFWTMFGFGDVADADITLPGNSSAPIYTEYTGYTIYGIFNLVFIIILVNMLIAVVSNSYDAIQEFADREWKFASTRLNMSYLNQYGHVPPPFNLFSPLRKFIKWLLCRYCRHKCSPYAKDNADVEQEYQRLMSTLKKRYWKQHAKKESAVVSNIFNNLPADLLDVDDLEEEAASVLQGNGHKQTSAL